MEKYFDINEAGCSIRCKLYAGDPADVRRVVVFTHGFGGHKDNRAAAKFAERVIGKYKHLAVITFDWPCHGTDARKKLLLADCDTYLTLVLAYIRKRWGEDTALYMYAISFGGYVTLKYVSEHENPFRRIALRCPAVNMYDSLTGTIMKQGDMDKLEKGRDVLVGFDRQVKVSAQFLQQLRDADVTQREFFDLADDMLIIHGTADEIVPFETSARFAEDNVIELIPVQGADHRFRDPNRMDRAIQLITEFFAL